MVIWQKFGANPALFGMIALMLVAWGVVYNMATAYSEKRGWTEGLLSLYVAGGVIGTLVGVAFIDLGAALLVGGAFICTGIPMIVGSIYRYVTRREAAQRAAREEAYDETEGVAKRGPMGPR